MSAAVAMVLLGCAVACSSPDQFPSAHYSSDPRIATLRTVPADAHLVGMMPLEYRSRVIGTAVTSSGLSFALAITGDKCELAMAAPHSGVSSFGVQAPENSNDESDAPTWRGAKTSIGHSVLVSAEVEPRVTANLWCGTEGAYFSVDVPASSVTSSVGLTRPELGQSIHHAGFLISVRPTN